MERSQIHNYFEHLVFDYIDEKVFDESIQKPDDYYLDIACVALNQLPTRYVRYEVDMAFYLHAEDRAKMQQQVVEAVDEAISYINAHFDSRR